MGRKPKKRRIHDDVRLAAFEKHCHFLATAVKEIKKNINSLLTADEVAKMCAMSKSSFLKLVNTGKAPEGLKLERLRRWNRKEILGWISAGCPDREKWNWLQSKSLIDERNKASLLNKRTELLDRMENGGGSSRGAQ